MKRGLRLIPVLSLVGFFSLACGSSDAQTEARVAEVCKGVTNENWYISFFGERSPMQFCTENAYVIGDDMLPCTLGGLPLLCRDNGSNMGVYTFGGQPVAFLNPEDRTRVGDGLQFIR